MKRPTMLGALTALICLCGITRYALILTSGASTADQNTSPLSTTAVENVAGDEARVKSGFYRLKPETQKQYSADLGNALVARMTGR